MNHEGTAVQSCFRNETEEQSASLLAQAGDLRRKFCSALEGIRFEQEKLNALQLDCSSALMRVTRSLNWTMEGEPQIETLAAGKAACRLPTSAAAGRHDDSDSRIATEQFSGLLDDVTDAMIVVDSSGQILYRNEAADRLFEWNSDSVLGQCVFSILDHDSKLFAGLVDGPENGPTQVRQGEVTTKGGKTFIVEVRCKEVHNRAGRLVGYLLIAADMTARRKLESAVNRNQRLESLGTLASGVAHDLNNVLTPILIGIRLLSSNKPHVNQPQLLHMMQESTTRAASLVNQILTFAGGDRSERTLVDMKQLILETVQFLEHSMHKSVRIETELGSDSAIVSADPTELSQILMNLCINARDAMPTGGCLTIRMIVKELDLKSANNFHLSNAGPYVVLTVSDNGCGIPTNLLNRIFDPFFTTKEVGKGTGLGLSTVRTIVKNYQGVINVSSDLGKGTQFSVYLPAVVRSTPGVGLEPESASPG